MQHEQAATAEAEPTSRFTEINGVKLHYLDWGGDRRKRTILMLHGGSAHVHWWDHVAPHLTGFGRVIALDHRGHGRSHWANPPVYGPSVYRGDICAFIREHTGKPALLVGHSMSGEIAQRIAVEHPDLLSAMVIIDSPHGRPPLRTRLMWRWKRRKQGGPRPEFKRAEDLVRRFRLSPPGHNLTSEALASLALKGAEQLPNGNWAFRFDPRTRIWRPKFGEMRKPSLKKVRVPVLILRGEHSALLSRRAARHLHRMIPGAVYKEISNAYHHVPLDNPQDTTAAIIEFIESL
ncbi:MAG: alpha/beta fold hydrolase [Candidatus Binataceae bacterium]